MSTTSSIHIAVLVFPFTSHPAALLNLVKRIAASAPENVKFSFLSTGESNNSIFSGARGDGEFGNIKAYDVWDGVPKDHVFSGYPLLGRIGLFLDACPDNFEKAIKEAEEDTWLKVSCLLTDAFLWFSSDLGQKIGVPWVAFSNAPAWSLSAHLYTDDIKRQFSANEQTVGKIPGLEGLRINDMPTEVLLNVEQSPIALLLYNMALNLNRANAVVVNSFEEMDPAITADLKSKFQKVFHVSPNPLLPPASKKEPNSQVPQNDECLEWLKKRDHASVIYIGFGNVNIPPPDEISALAEALETRKSPFLWSLRDHARVHLPAGFVDRTNEYGKFVSWAPQVEVLASGKVGVYVSHGGWNSVFESISCGVPLICRPFFADQPLNCAMVENKWRIGLRVKDGVFTKEGTVNALEVILSSEKGKEIKENVQLLKGKAIDVVNPNGSSKRNLQELVELITKS